MNINNVDNAMFLNINIVGAFQIGLNISAVSNVNFDSVNTFHVEQR